MTRPVPFDLIEIEARARAMRAAHIRALFASMFAQVRRVRPHGAAARA